MSRRRVRPKSKAAKAPTVADLVLDPAGELTVLDVLDNLLNKGVVLNGDVVLGVAGVDLVYLRLSALLSAIDRVMSGKPDARRGPRRLKKP